MPGIRLDPGVLIIKNGQCPTKGGPTIGTAGQAKRTGVGKQEGSIIILSYEEAELRGKLLAHEFQCY